MEHTWRWFGPEDPVRLSDIRQAGATGVVTALHHVPNGEVWEVAEIQRRKDQIEAAGLTWSVVESIPVHEDIKRGLPTRDRYLERYAQSVRNLAACGIDVVCYNVMPVLDWTRTDLAYPLPDGAWALRFDHVAFAAFDLFILQRPGAREEYDEADVAAARAYHEALGEGERERLVASIIAGLPGTEEHYTLDTIRERVAGYDGIDRDALRENVAVFLRHVVPVAEGVGVRMAAHPDDPPRPLLGLPRVLSTLADARWWLDVVDVPANGLTFCTGSYGVRPDNDLVAMVRELAPRLHFVHLRSTRREADPRSFHESYHLGSAVGADVDMVGVVREIVREERRRREVGLTGPRHRLPMRPDHGHQLLYDQESGRRTNPGYSLLGRMKGLAELRGIEAAVNALA